MRLVPVSHAPRVWDDFWQHRWVAQPVDILLTLTVRGNVFAPCVIWMGTYAMDGHNTAIILAFAVSTENKEHERLLDDVDCVVVARHTVG